MHSMVSSSVILGNRTFITKGLLGEMLCIYVDIRLVSHDCPVWFQKPSNQHSVKGSAVLFSWLFLITVLNVKTMKINHIF